jgi:DNA (cytosine-5)-methyltransferase 1
MIQPRLPFDDSRNSDSASVPSAPLRVAGLFAGIGGIELGLQRAGHHAHLLCENDEPASRVLQHAFPGVALAKDVRTLPKLPDVDLIAAGFPCQDLSISGRTSGITGARSGLVDHVFRLIRGASASPRWILLENVPFLLRLQGGAGMTWLIEQLEGLGYRWAYRIIDTRAFGIPQRRERLIVLASQESDPTQVLLADDAGRPQASTADERPACGFYWTEGHRGIGWSRDCMPPIKVGSGLGIPSPPAVWFADGRIATPDIGDLERLQGFPIGHTAIADESKKRSRARLVGNAVSVPIAEWLGQRLCRPGRYDGAHDWALGQDARWPSAAWGERGSRYESSASTFPRSDLMPPLAEFLREEGTELSSRACAGLLNRLTKYGTRVPEDFVADLCARALSADAVAA